MILCLAGGRGPGGGMAGGPWSVGVEGHCVPALAGLAAPRSEAQPSSSNSSSSGSSRPQNNAVPAWDSGQLQGLHLGRARLQQHQQQFQPRVPPPASPSPSPSPGPRQHPDEAPPRRPIPVTELNEGRGSRVTHHYYGAVQQQQQRLRLQQFQQQQLQERQAQLRLQQQQQQEDEEEGGEDEEGGEEEGQEGDGQGEQEGEQQPQRQLARSGPASPMGWQDTTRKDTSVEFCIQHGVEFGQKLRLIGTHPRLGEWKLAAGVDMQWSQGDNWRAPVSLPSGTVHEYKYVVMDSWGQHAVAWQQGNNSVLALTAGEERVQVTDNWWGAPGAEVKGASGAVATREHRLLDWAGDLEKTVTAQRQELRTVRRELAEAQEDGRRSRAQIATLQRDLDTQRHSRAVAERRLEKSEGELRRNRELLAEQQASYRHVLGIARDLLEEVTADEEEEEEQERERPRDKREGRGGDRDRASGRRRDGGDSSDGWSDEEEEAEKNDSRRGRQSSAFSENGSRPGGSNNSSNGTGGGSSSSEVDGPHWAGEPTRGDAQSPSPRASAATDSGAAEPFQGGSGSSWRQQEGFRSSRHSSNGASPFSANGASGSRDTRTYSHSR